MSGAVRSVTLEYLNTGYSNAAYQCPSFLSLDSVLPS